MSTPAEPARTTTADLVAAGFQEIVWPGRPGLHIYRHHHATHLIHVILEPGRGHQVVIASEWDGQRWHIHGEYGHDPNGQPYTITTAVAQGIRLVEQRRAA